MWHKKIKTIEIKKLKQHTNGTMILNQIANIDISNDSDDGIPLVGYRSSFGALSSDFVA